MGFVILFNTALIITFIKPRLAPRPKGPLVEWAAFRELPYTLFAVGIYLALSGLYFAYYYVSKVPSNIGCRAVSVDSKLTPLYSRSPSLVKQSFTYLHRRL